MRLPIHTFGRNRWMPLRKTRCWIESFWKMCAPNGGSSRTGSILLPQKGIRVVLRYAHNFRYSNNMKDVICTLETRQGPGSSGLYIFVEPSEWDETKGPKPIKELRVQCDNFLRSRRALPAEAVESNSNIPCEHMINPYDILLTEL